MKVQSLTGLVGWGKARGGPDILPRLPKHSQRAFESPSADLAHGEHR